MRDLLKGFLLGHMALCTVFYWVDIVNGRTKPAPTQPAPRAQVVERIVIHDPVKVLKFSDGTIAYWKNDSMYWDQKCLKFAQALPKEKLNTK